jgi:hypothetical protein
MCSLLFTGASSFAGVHILNVTLMNAVIVSGVCGDSIFQYSETYDDRLLPESNTVTCRVSGVHHEGAGMVQN